MEKIQYENEIKEKKLPSNQISCLNTYIFTSSYFVSLPMQSKIESMETNEDKKETQTK